jgi:S1-C subfamily serine protease
MTTEQQTTTRRVADAVSPAVVRIGRHGGRGCGVVVADGLVVTNAHNLRDRTTQVTFADGRSLQARAAGIDADGDLTVLAVDTGGVAGPAWAPDPPAEGMTVYAVAAIPGGRRVTSGAVSAVDRSFRGPRGRLVTGAIEHTAPLARGTSGSPVVDAEGRLVGITTLRLGDGFSLAQPTGAELRRRVDALAVGDEPRRRRLGVGLAPPRVARRLRAAVGLPEREGALVRGVAEGSAAERAGIATGDLITAVGGVSIAGPTDLEAVLARPDLGATVTVHVVRGGDELDLTVTFDDDLAGGDVADAPTDDAAAGAPADAPADDDQGGGTGG